MSFFVDVHTHLTHEAFANDRTAVIAHAKAAGLGAIICNGLNPESNREILQMAKDHPVVRPALGIYPLDAVNDLIPADFPFAVAKFSVTDEIAFIRAQAESGKLIAIGECGLDGHYLGEEFLPPQEKVFEELIGVALSTNLPLIIHTRRCEARAGEILAAHGVKKVDFHCFGGRVNLAKQYAEKFGWWFSIPAVAKSHEGFRKMLSVLPPEKILTETDAPYLPPVKGERNEPANVVGTVGLFAAARGTGLEAAKEQIYQNYLNLFEPRS